MGPGSSVSNLSPKDQSDGEEEKKMPKGIRLVVSLEQIRCFWIACRRWLSHLQRRSGSGSEKIIRTAFLCSTCHRTQNEEFEGSDQLL
jgi:hypothetical protein